MYTISEPYPLTIDRTRTLEQMIAAGRYDWVDPNITAGHFPVEGGNLVTADALIVHLGPTMSTGAVLAELDRLNLRPGDITELLAFGARYPEVQRLFPIVTHASVWADRDGTRYVTCLWSNPVGRNLGLSGVRGGWSDLYRFLAFHKS